MHKFPLYIFIKGGYGKKDPRLGSQALKSYVGSNRVKIFSIIYQSLPYKYLRDYKGLLYQYFKSSANPIQIQIVIANLSAFDFKYSGIFLSSRNIGVLNAGILSISRNIGSAVAPPVQLPL